MEIFVNLSVVIVTYRSQKYIDRCIKSIYEGTTQELTFEIIIIDNAPDDGLAELVRANFPEIKVIENERNEGFSRAVNQGASIARGKYLCILNPDTELYPGALGGLIDFLEKHQDVEIVGPRAVDHNGRGIPSCRSLPHIGNTLRYPISLFLNGRLLSKPKRFLLDKWNQNRTIDLKKHGGYISGTCLLIRLEFFKQIGMLDERYFLYYEDADLGFRALQRGARTFFVAESCLVHLVGQSAIQNPRAPLHAVEGCLYYVHKNFNRLHGSTYWVCFLCLVLAWTVKAWAKGEKGRLPTLKGMLKSFLPCM